MTRIDETSRCMFHCKLKKDQTSNCLRLSVTYLINVSNFNWKQTLLEFILIFSFCRKTAKTIMIRHIFLLAHLILNMLKHKFMQNIKFIKFNAFSIDDFEEFIVLLTLLCMKFYLKCSWIDCLFFSKNYPRICELVVLAKGILEVENTCLALTRFVLYDRNSNIFISDACRTQLMLTPPWQLE